MNSRMMIIRDGSSLPKVNYERNVTRPPRRRVLEITDGADDVEFMRTPERIRILNFGLKTKKRACQPAAQFRVIDELLFCWQTIRKIGQIQGDRRIAIR